MASPIRTWRWGRPSEVSTFATILEGSAVRVGAILAVFIVLERWLFGVARLPETAYHEPLIALEALKAFFARPPSDPSLALRVAVPLALVTALVLVRRRLWARWVDLDPDRIVGRFVAVSTVLLAWAFSTYEYNLYFDQPHVLDRLALVVLAGLVVWRPIFVLPFVAQVVAIAWQFTHPIAGYSVAEPFALARILLLLFAYLLTRAVLRSPRARDYMFLAFTVLAAGYVLSGWGKLRLGWFSTGDVALLLPATYANGWLGFLEADTVGAVTAGLSRIDVLLVGATFVVECAAIACLLKRRVLLFFLVAWIGFHLAVFGLTGIFFWKWIVLEIAAVVLLVRHPRAPALDFFRRPYAVLSVPVIVLGTAVYDPVNLSWYDSAVSYTYRVEGFGPSGERFSLPPRFFAPYDYQFTVGAFGYLSPYRQLEIAWGTTRDRQAAAELARAEDLDAVEVLEASRGEVLLQETRAASFDDFLMRFVGNRNERGQDTGLLRVLAAPPHLWTVPRPDAHAGDERINRVEVRQITSLFDGRRYRELRSRPIRAVDVPTAPPFDVRFPS